MRFVPSQRGARVWMRAIVALAITAGGCAALVEDDPSALEGDADDVGVLGIALSSSSLLSANGTYGSACAGGRANASWSVTLQMGAALDNASLSVAKGNTACVLRLTSLRTGAGASNLYTAQSPIVLSTTYPMNSTLFTGSGGNFTANAVLSSVSFTANFTLTVMASADPTLSTSARSTLLTYDAYILNTQNPLSYWRLNESVTASDDFTGTAGTTLQSKTGAVTWTRTSGTTSDAVLSDQGRVRDSSTTRAVYGSSIAPSSADYAAAGDVYVKSVLTDDLAGVTLRTTANQETYYFAGYIVSSTLNVSCGCFPKQWQMWKVVLGITSQLVGVDATLTPGTSYHLFFQARSGSLQLFVDGVQKLTATDAVFIAGPGSPGVAVGATTTTAQTNTTGLHVDNFSVQYFPAADSKGTNTGSYYNPVNLGDPGALTASNNKAVTWVGSGYMDAARQIADDFSIEFWYKATSGIGAGVTAWYNGAGLVDANTSTSAPNGFGVSVRADGKILAGAAASAVDQATILSTSTPALNAWHHVVFTRTKSSGAMALYIDGAAAGTATAAINVSLTSATRINFGRTQTGNYFSGSMDEIAVYSSVLSAATVTAHYQHR